MKLPIKKDVLNFMNRVLSYASNIIILAILSISGFYVAYALYTFVICMYGGIAIFMHGISLSYVIRFVEELYLSECVPNLKIFKFIVLLNFTILLSFFVRSTLPHILKDWKVILLVIMIIGLPILLGNSPFYIQADVLTSPSSWGGDRNIEIYNDFHNGLISLDHKAVSIWSVAFFLLPPLSIGSVALVKKGVCDFFTIRRLFKISFRAFFVMLFLIVLFVAASGLLTMTYNSLENLKAAIFQSGILFLRYGLILIPYSVFILLLFCISGLKDWLFRHKLIAQVCVGVFMLISLFIISYIEVKMTIIS